MLAPMISRITFVTIGQTPRADLVPEIVAHLPIDVDVAELGALDGLAGEEIARRAPGPDDHALVTRLRDGTQAVIGKRWVTGRLQELLRGPGATAGDGEATARNGTATARNGEATARNGTATVLLCTGEFAGLRGPGLFLDAQHLVDHGVAALCAGARSVGLLVPLARQQDEHHYAPPAGQALRTAHASPYEDPASVFEEAGRALAGCDLVVMHCMGYTEEQRSAVVAGAGRPVLLARRLVASALAQLL